MLQDWQLYFIGLITVFFWFFKLLKSSIFWMYLWQLKNYHIGRFLAHFETKNGKDIFYNTVFLVKFFLLILAGSFIAFEFFGESNYSLLPEYVISPVWIFLGITAFVLAVEGFASMVLILSNKFLKPGKTSKVMFLSVLIFLPLFFLGLLFLNIFFNGVVSGASFEVSQGLFYAFLLLLIDAFLPLIVSIIILSVQPFTVFVRNKTIEKARKKIKELDNLSVIGITGSYGKSSTKEFLRLILEESFKVVTTVKNQNSEIGISECILREVNDSHEVFICEMGAYNRGGIRFLCSIAQPKIGILTAIGNQHLSTFGSQENIVKGKFELIDSLPNEGLAVLNWDNEYIKSTFNSKVANIKCSISKKEDIWAENIDFNKEGISFEACFKNGERIRIETGILGEYNISNLLLCIATAKKIGVSKEEIANGCKKITPEISGMEMKITNHGFSVIDSSYSANKAGVVAHLDYFKRIDAKKKIIVMPCIIELGKEAKQTHYEIGRKIADSCDLVIVTSGDYFNDLKKGAIDNGMKEDCVLCLTNPVDAFSRLKREAEGGVVLLEGRSSSLLIKRIFEN